MSVQAFHDVRLPVDVEIGARGGPGFQTTTTILNGGGEQRNSDWSEFRCKFDVGYGISSLSDLNEVYEFFIARRGRGRGFRFKDWKDYSIELETIGTGNGATVAFQIIKTYDDSGPEAYVRRITRPVTSTVKVYLDGVLKTLTTHYTLGTAANSGLVTFLAAPANAVVVKVTCEFDVPSRFDTDDFEITHEAFEAGEVQSLQIVELRE